ncbi:MAG TPA: 30S ribosomal protein S27ae [Candidatus Nanoarchaeia archaeon]|nr:30S ribosomal protein S27ae [Candidatus Nanoarchaeia archaeon]
MAAPPKPAAKPAAKAGKSSKKGIWNLYAKTGDKLERKNKSCPKCGPGVFLAKHTNRLYCGHCRYCEFIKQ